MLNHLKKLGQDIYTQEIQSVFPTVAKTIAHIFVVDSGWLEMMQGWQTGSKHFWMRKNLWRRRLC